MKNKQILAGALLATLIATTATYAANTSTWTTSTWTTKETRQKIELTDEQKAQMVEMRALMTKVKNGETLTEEEQAKVDEFKSQMWNKMWGKWFGWERSWKADKSGRDGFWKWMMNLTDEEKTQLESMTDEEKQAFFETKRAEAEAKKEAQETVINKLLNGETLTEAEKVIVEEIKTQRAEQKARKAERDAIKALMEKVKNGETLTTEEQATVDAFKAQREERKANISDKVSTTLQN